MRLTLALLTAPVAALAVQLPPEMEADRFLLQAESAFEEQDFDRAKAAMDRILELQVEHDLELPERFPFRYAQVLERLGLYDEAMEVATRYLTTAGREGEFYREALELLNDAEAAKAAAIEAAEAARVAAEAEAKAAAEAATRQPGDVRMFDGMEFVWVPAGEFQMGSTSSDAWNDEQPVTRVRISRGFWLGMHEVTQSDWQRVMGTNPSWFSGCDRCPVETVSWNDAQEFTRSLNGRSGGNRYRLPREAEWEYAARAGTTADRYGDIDVVAWHEENSEGSTRPVGQKAPNAWGLHDMLGNVYEWVQDRGGDYPGGFVTDPRGAASGSRRTSRGGSWGGEAWRCRASHRAFDSPDTRNEYAGIRLLRME